MSQESIYVPGETYTSARATPELVGREQELGQIEDAIRDTDNSYIVYVTGQGGIGKTRLMKYVLERPPEDVSLVVASDLIDLYHTRVHSLAGLIGAILEVVEPLAGFFKSQLARTGVDKLEALARAEQEGASTAEVISRREELTELLLKVLNQFTGENRLVLALDTAEHLLVERDPAQQALGLTGERPAILDWLLNDFLPNVRNAVVLLAGRPGPGNLAQELNRIAQSSGQRFLPISLQGLSEEDALQYFEAVIQSARSSKDPRETRAAESIVQWSEDDRRVIFHCLRDEGPHPSIRPILLALAIDYQVTAGRPLPALNQSLADAEKLSAEQREGVRQELGRGLVEMICENSRPADDVIVALAWLRKGADSELLSRLIELDREDVEKALGKTRELSFVKIRPADDRVFLHDEMYDLIQQYALDRMPERRKERIFSTLRDYYDELARSARDEIAGLYQPLVEPALPDPGQIIAARARLQDALVEDLHYRLRWNTAQGFQTYFRYAEEAIAANDESLDMQLRAELLGFLSKRDPSGKAEEIDNLRRADVTADAAVRWVKRLIYDGRHRQALDIAQHLRTRDKYLIDPGGDLAEGELDTWEALALIYSGEYERAKELLRVNELEEKFDESQRGRFSAILARACNNLGYLYRVQGQFVAAANFYSRALPYWDSAEIEAEKANTLTNLAFALAKSGRFSEARRLALEALALRERLGPRGPVALSCSTLAEIETHAGHYREAEPYAQRAIAIARTLDFQRGEGLALLSIANLRRFMSEAPDLSVDGKMKLLEEALSESQATVDIFSKVGETEHKIKALYQSGVTSREMSRISVLKKDKEKYFQTAEESLGQAIDQARGERLWLSYLDASLGLAWMYHYARESKKLDKILQRLDEDIQEHFSDYVIVEGKLPVKREDTLVGVFTHFGRLHMLRGVRAMCLFEESDKQPPYRGLKEAAREFTFALEYNLLLAEDHQGIRRATSIIHNHVKNLSLNERKAFYDAVTATAQELGRGREECRLWRELENAFGPYETIKRVAR